MKRRKWIVERSTRRLVLTATLPSIAVQALMHLSGSFATADPSREWTRVAMLALFSLVALVGVFLPVRPVPRCPRCDDPATRWNERGGIATCRLCQIAWQPTSEEAEEEDRRARL